MNLPEPITRKEIYLKAIAENGGGGGGGGSVDLPEPVTREEIFLKAIADNGGGGGGTTDYEQLTNLPKVNGVELSGDKSASQLGLQSALTFDDTPTEGSTNPVTSGGVYSGLNTVNQNFGTVELSSVAAYPHKAGECFINAAGQFVQCTAAIAVGDTISSGANVTRQNIANNGLIKLVYTVTDLNSMPRNSYTVIASRNADNQPPNAGDIEYGHAAVVLHLYTGGAYSLQLYFNTKGVSAIRTLINSTWQNWVSL